MALNDCRSAVIFWLRPPSRALIMPREQQAQALALLRLPPCISLHLFGGPCEHAYCCMEHEGQSSTTVLPKAKPKGRPRKTMAVARPTPHQI